MVIAAPIKDLSNPETATVATGQTATDRINMAGRHPVGIYIPAGAEGASVTFQVAQDIGGALFALHDDAGAAYSVAIAAGQYRQINPRLFRGARELVMTVNTAQVGADADFVIMFADPDANF